MIGIVEVGNTCLKTGIYINDKITHFQRFDLQEGLTTTVEMPGSVNSVLVAGSGSPEIRARFAEAFAQTMQNVIMVTKEGQLPFVNHYADGQAGIDRLANVAACIADDVVPAVIIDAGSAITVDVVGTDSSYLGGVIMPGIRMQGRALNKGTASLPIVKQVDCAPPVIGTSTEEAIWAGILYGTSGAVSHISAMVRQYIGHRCPVILTGGDAKLLSKYCSIPDTTIDEQLTLRGLMQIALHRNPELAP